MILADKIINLRKKNGWSQEELAERLGVSRQSVSKYEGAQSVPDLDKILKLSEIFGVTTDYLIKDDIEEEQYSEYQGYKTNEVILDDIVVPGNTYVTTYGTDAAEGAGGEAGAAAKGGVAAARPRVTPRRMVSMETAREYLDVIKRSAPAIGLGVMMCIISPVPLMILAVANDMGIGGISENMAAGIGLCALILLVAMAVAIFITNGMKLSRYEFIYKEEIETEYGVTGMVRDYRNRLHDEYVRDVVAGTVLCICSVIPMFIIIAINEEDDFMIVCSVGMLLAMVAAGVFFFIKGGMQMSAVKQLLEEGDYTRSSKLTDKKTSMPDKIYWLVATALYIGYSFVTYRWDRSWMIWPVAGVLFPVYHAVVAYIVNRNEQ